ncbi:MAG: hypothetical protein LBD20_02655 [Spirochaetaceae bacterium]|jgi:hypothetical protein|nr:hypothetical protein [Spirochaetaceae bacterium]
MVKEVLTVFKAREEVSSSLLQISNNAGKMSRAVTARVYAVNEAFKAMGQTSRAAAGHLERVKDVFSGAFLAQAAFSGITSFLGAAKGAFSEAVSYTSSIIESQNVINTVFGEGASAIDEFSKKARDSFGLSEQQVKSFASTFGGMFSAMGIDEEINLQMTKGLTALSGDLASFYNLPIEEAFQKITSGMAGQTEPLLKVGVNMSVKNLEEFAKSKGFKGALKDLGQMEKTMLRYSFLLESTKNAQGDFGKPIASWAVSSQQAVISFKELQGKMVEGLMPSMITVADMVNNTLQKLTAHIVANKAVFEELGRGIEKTAAFAIAAAPKVIDFGQSVLQIAPAALAAGVAVKGMFAARSIFTGIGAFKSSLTEALLVQSRMPGIIMNTKWALEAQAQSASGAAVKYMGLASSITLAKVAMVGLATAAVAGLVMVADHVINMQESEMKKTKMKEFGVDSETYDKAHESATESARIYVDNLSAEDRKYGNGEQLRKKFYEQQLDAKLSFAKYESNNKDRLDKMNEEAKAEAEKKTQAEALKKLMEEFYGMVGEGFDKLDTSTKSLKDPVLNPAAMGVTDIWEIMRRGNSGFSLS